MTLALTLDTLHKERTRGGGGMCYPGRGCSLLQYSPFSLLKGQSHEIFCTQFFSSISSFWSHLRCLWAILFILLFHRVIALLKKLPGTLATGELQLPGTLGTWESLPLRIQRARESLFFYLDLDIGPPWVNFKAINLKFSQIVGHIVFYNLWLISDW